MPLPQFNMIGCKNPSVSIGLPIYNNSRFLDKTIKSVLEQSYDNLSIYLSDDCSTDQSQAICEKYAKLDSRIQYSRNRNNIGPSENHKYTLRKAKTKYFMFVRGHEILPPKLIENCVNVMENDKSVVLAVTKSAWIDEDDKILHGKPIGFYDTRGVGDEARCIFAIWGSHEYVYGLTRTELMKKARLKRDMVGMDFIVLLELALEGSFAVVDSGTRYRRYHYSEENYKKRIQRYVNRSYSQLKAIDRIFPLARLPFGLSSVVMNSDKPLKKRLTILLSVLLNAPAKYIVSKGQQL